MDLPNIDGLVLPAVQGSIGSCELSQKDQGAAALAIRYAKAIDGGSCRECGSKGDVLDRLGPKLLAALSALNLTPAARNVPKGGEASDSATDNPAASALASLRARAAQRAG